MNETVMDKKGISERLLHELLKSPKFKASLRMVLNEIDPATLRSLVRTLVWDDVETFMGVVGSLPKLIELMAELVGEMGVQLGNFPPAVLRSFVYQLVGNIDGRALGEAAGNLHVVLDVFRGQEEGREILSKIAADAREGFQSVAGEGTEGLGALTVIAAEVGQVLRDNPDFVNGVLKPVIEGLKDASPEIFGVAPNKTAAKK
jgi:hypothetical protein